MKFVFKAYNPQFPTLFIHEKDRIAKHLKMPCIIEHVGSTAVPGLGGKGIIDIAIAADRSSFSSLITEFQHLGYEYFPKYSTLDRHFFKNLPFHLHLTYLENKEWADFLKFRDYLRAHPEARDEYADLKKRAALEANHEGAKYREIKAHIFSKFTSN